MSLYGIRTSDEVTEIINKAEVLREFHKGKVRHALRRQRKFIVPTPTLRERLEAYKAKKRAAAARLARKQEIELAAELREQVRQKARETRARNLANPKPALWPIEKQRRSRVNWSDIVPEDIAKLQEKWERRNTMKSLREATGMTYKSIGELFGLSIERTRQNISKVDRELMFGRRSPVERWMDTPTVKDPKEARALLRITSSLPGARDWLHV